jgi:WD40 repeat protein
MRIGTTRFRSNVDNGGRIEAMAFTKDGKHLVTISDYTGAKVWDVATGKTVLTFGIKPTRDGWTSYALSADGSRAAIAESEKVCRLYDTANGKEIGRAAGDWSTFTDLRFSPDNKLLGVLHYGEPGAVAVWDVASRTQLWRIPVPLGICSGAFAFTPDGKIIVCDGLSSKPEANGKRGPAVPLLFYDAAKGPKSQYASPMTIVFPPGLLFAGDSKEFAFSPDGKLLAARESPRQFMLWDFATGKLLHEPKIDDDDQMGVGCLCFSPDAKGIFTGSNTGRVRLWDVVNGKLKRQFSGHDTSILALAVSPDSKRIAASCIDDTLRLWDVDSGKELLSFDGHRMRNVQARFSSNGKTIVSICGFNPTPSRTADERTYRFWDVTTGKPLKRVELSRKGFLPFCLSGDANVLFVIDAGKITKRNLINGKIEQVRGLPANYYRYQCSFEGRYLAGHSDDFWSRGRGIFRNVDELVTTNTLKVVNTTNGKAVLAFEGRKGEQFHCRFTADGRYLAVNSFCYETNGEMGYRSNMELKQSFLTLWDMQTGRKTSESNLLERKWNGDFRWPGGDSLSPDRSLALTRGKEFVELRDVKMNSKLAQFEADNLGRAGSLECETWAFSPDGKVIAIGDQKGQILVWSVSARKALGTLAGHEAAVTSVQFSPDGKTLLSGSDDTTILLWDVAQWTPK